jgi:zinc/manganese transport system substrate-binding protein
VRVVGYLEPLPGIPPTARHLTQLTSRLEAKQGVVLYALFQPDRGARFLQERIGWPGRAVPLEPREPTIESYLALLRDWAQALSGSV